MRLTCQEPISLWECYGWSLADGCSIMLAFGEPRIDDGRESRQGIGVIRYGGPMDEDLTGMSREQLMEEVRKLRRGIRTHRDSTEHELASR